MDNKNVFARNLQYQMNRLGKSRRDVCDDLRLNYATFSDWCLGRKYPRMDKVEQLAEYFGILKSDLIEERTPEYWKMNEKAALLAKITIKAQRDPQFYRAIEALYKMDSVKLDALMLLMK